MRQEEQKTPSDTKQQGLVQSIRQWWSEHPMSYQGYVRPDLKTDDEYREFFRKVDEAWWTATNLTNTANPKYLCDNIISKEEIAGGKVLEIGCGMGTMTEQFSSWGCDVTAIDLATTSIEMTRKRLELANLTAAVMEMDAGNLRFPNEHFDFVWSWGVIHHSPHTEEIVREIHRVMKRGAGFAIMVYYTFSLHSMHVLLRHGVIGGQLFKYDWQDLQNRWSDGAEHGGVPLARSWTRKGFRELLSPLKVSRVTNHSNRDAAFLFVPTRPLKSLARALVPCAACDMVTGRFGHCMLACGHKNE
jgi:ubiquinone/menaquinone biosynthesis C-methylase UbiE